MHIIHLVTRLLRAGSEENTMATCRWQAEAGHQVTLLHGRDFDPHWYEVPVRGVELVCLPELCHPISPVNDFRALAKLRQIFRARQPDVIHTHQSKVGILGRIAADVLPDATVVHGIHIVPFEGVSPSRRILYVAAEKLAARRTDLFIGVSEAVGQAYVDAGISPSDRVSCVRSGMDLAKFRAPNLPDDWRDLLGVNAEQDRPKVALMLAALEPRKRHLAFLEALAAQANAFPDVKVLLAGRGPEEARLRKAAADLGLENMVVFCGYRSDPEALLALADVSLLTSEREGLPRVAVQSMAAGCPMVVSELPGIREVIRDDVNGYVTSAGDLSEAVACLWRLLTDDARLAGLQRGAAGTEISDWELGALGARTTALYRRSCQIARSEAA